MDWLIEESDWPREIFEAIAEDDLKATEDIVIECMEEKKEKEMSNDPVLFAASEAGSRVLEFLLADPRCTGLGLGPSGSYNGSDSQAGPLHFVSTQFGKQQLRTFHVFSPLKGCLSWQLHVMPDSPQARGRPGCLGLRREHPRRDCIR